MKRLTVLLFLTSALNSWGQGAQENNFYSSTSPNSGDVSTSKTYAMVDEVHGTLNNTIPLHVINYGGITIPVSLNYAATGIKAREKSSEVGLGWQLNSVGSINRNALGFPDEGKLGRLGLNYNWYGSVYTSSGILPLVPDPIGMCITHSELFPIPFNESDPPKEYLARRGWLMHGVEAHDIDNWWPNDYPPGVTLDCNSSEYKIFPFLVRNGGLDLQPDWFILNGPFAVGNFFLTKSDESVLDKTTNLRAAFIPMNGSHSLECKLDHDEKDLYHPTSSNNNFGTLSPFVLKTIEGIYVKYDQTAHNATSYDAPKSNNPLGLGANEYLNTIDTWYPSIIKNTLNDKEVVISYSEVYVDQPEEIVSSTRKSFLTTDFTTTRKEGKRLITSISYATGAMIFSYDDELREDNSTLPVLASITISEFDQIVKTIHFEYDHIGCDLDPNGRLILKRIVFRKNEIEIESIDLDYFDHNFCFDDNASIDHWGFPNVQSTEGFPSTQKFWNQPNLEDYSHGTANKTPSLSHTKHGVLKGMSNSNGYSEEYLFELHKVINGDGLDCLSEDGLDIVGGLRIHQITSANGNGESMISEYNYENGRLKNKPNYITLHGDPANQEVHHSSENLSSVTFSDGGHVIYEEVYSRIITPETTDDFYPHGRIVNIYDYAPESFVSNHPHPVGANKDWASGYLKKQVFYNSEDEIILEKYFDFEEFDTGIEIQGYKPALADLAAHSSSQNLYTIEANYFLPTSITETEYKDGLEVNETTTAYRYDESSFSSELRYDLPIEIETTLGSGEQILKTFKYSTSYETIDCLGPQELNDYSSNSMIKVLRYAGKIGLKTLPIVKSSYYRESNNVDYKLLGTKLNLYEINESSSALDPSNCSDQLDPYTVWTFNQDLTASYDEVPNHLITNFPYGSGPTWEALTPNSDASYILYTDVDQEIEVSLNNPSSFFDDQCTPCSRALWVRLRGHAGSSGQEYTFRVDIENQWEIPSIPTQFIPEGAYFVETQIITLGSGCSGGNPSACPQDISFKLRGSYLEIPVGNELPDLSVIPNFLPIRLSEVRTNESTVPQGVSVLSDTEYQSDLESFYYDASIFNHSVFNEVEYNSFGSITKLENSDGLVISSFIDPTTNLKYAQISNGSLTTSRYTSFESNYHGGWEPDASGIIDLTETDNLPSGCPLYAPSGNKIYHLNGNTFNSISNGTEYLSEGRYILSFYSSGYFYPLEANTQVNVISSSSKEVGEWIYNEYVFEWPQPGTWQISMGGNGFIDELRLHEADALMSTKGHYSDGKLMYEADALSNIRTFEYDSKDRLEWVFDEEKYVIEHHKYSEKNILDENSFNKHSIYSAKEENLQKTGFSDLAISSPGKVAKSTTFTDGWGRHRQTQTLNVNSATDGMVSFSDYDSFGRQLKKYLPYVTHLSDSETYIESAISDQENYYLNTDDPSESTSVAFTETIVENSPLQRPLEQTGTGEDFQSGSGHTTNMEYSWNTASENIRKWHFEEYDPIAEMGTWANSNSTYPENALKKTVRTDPNGVQSVSFTDALGREVASGVYVTTFNDASGNKVTGSIEPSAGVTELVLTYSVFDSFNRLRYIIPAKAIEQMVDVNHFYVSHWEDDHANNHHEFISYYGYDDKGRLAKEKRPSEEKTRWYYFDQKDRLILERLPSHPADVHNFYKYDNQDRIICTGEIMITDISDLQVHIDGLASEPDESFVGVDQTNSIYGYTNQSFPTIAENDVMQVFYFDNYDFGPSGEHQFQSFENTADHSSMTRGLATGSQTRILPADGSTGQMLMTISYYDERRRPIQAITENHKGGFDRLSSLYNERGQIEKTIQLHKYQESSTPVEVITEFIYYSVSGKLRTIKHKVDEDTPVYISNRGYDDFGKLKELNLHKRGSANYMQSIDYRYNEKGQLTHINNASLVIDAFNEEDSDVFGQELMYHQMSPEAELQMHTENYPEPNFNADYNGNISGMIWNAKTPDEDGAETNRHLYTYQYDDLGQLIEADYGRDHPSDPGQFNKDYGRFSANYNYDLGGNITRLQRRNQDKYNYLPDDGSGSNDPVASTDFMDDLTYTYRNVGFLLDRVDESSNGMSAFSSLYSHFTDGAQQDVEYSYDQAGRNIVDLNKEVSTDYNSVNRPSLISGPLGTTVSYIYDAAGNKLQKIIQGTKGGSLHTIETDYIGNFIYEYGELKMIYHPEGVVRLTPEDSENETEYVYDYFIKDYLGNVRVVLTGENATEEVKFLATMEEVHRLIESENFDNLNETAAALPSEYPVGGSVALNERIAFIIAEGEMTIGPSLVTPVRKGEIVNASVEYFYEEDAPGATYDNLGFFVDEILVSLASSAAGVVPIGEGMLNNIASGNTPLGGQLYQLLSNSIDTTDMSRPHGYLVYVTYDNNQQIVPASSGAIQVTDPNQLRTILTNDIVADKEGFTHIYVSNGSAAKGINFDNFLVTLTKAKTRQFNHYYPYGLPIAGIDGNHNDYLNKYTGKEHQTGEFMQFGVMNRGVEMFDFDARFFEPQLARWAVPDPAMQFSNPYLGIGNNPVMYVDPDGQFAFAIPLFLKAVAIGAGIGGASYTAQTAFGKGGFSNWNGGQFWKSVGFGALSGGLSYGIGSLNAGALNSSVYHGISQGVISELRGGSFEEGLGAGAFSSIVSTSLLAGSGNFGKSTAGNLAISGLSGGIASHAAGGNFWQGFGTGVTVAGLNHLSHLATRPKFEDLMRNFPVDDNGDPLKASKVYEEIGGQVKSEYDRDPSAYANACALRVSCALNGSGVEIPDMGPQTLTGADGKNYFFRASNLYEWLSRTYGKPNISTSNYSSLKGNTGIYIMQAHYPRDFGAWGHATLYNMTGTLGNPYNNSYAYQFNLWKFR